MLPRDPIRSTLYSENPANFLARLNYSFSTLHCLPCSMSQPNARAVSTAIRPRYVKAFAQEAGFKSCELAYIADFFKVYCLE